MIFKGYGIQSDQEIAELVGYEDDILECLSASIEACHGLGIFTQIQVSWSTCDESFGSSLNLFQALKYISTKMKTSSKQYGQSQQPRRNRIDEARELLAHIILAHVPVSFTQPLHSRILPLRISLARSVNMITSWKRSTLLRWFDVLFKRNWAWWIWTIEIITETNV